MSDKSGYVGRIKNGGTQVVKAPNQQTDAKKGDYSYRLRI